MLGPPKTQKISKGAESTVPTRMEPGFDSQRHTLPPVRPRREFKTGS